MRQIGVATAALNQRPMDWAGNKYYIMEAIEIARSKGAQLLVLPELAISGYACEDVFFMPALAETAWQCLLDLLPQTQEMVVVVGLPLRHAGTLYNAVAVVVDGKILGLVPKQKLAADGAHYESRWFKSWPAGHVEQILVAGQRYPLGDLLFDVQGVVFGIEICRDAWGDARTGETLIARGAKLLLNPSASHFALDKIDKRYAIAKKVAGHYNIPFIYSNLLGNEAGSILFDGDLRILSPEAHYEGPRFSLERVQVLAATIAVAQANPGNLSAATIACDFLWRPSRIAPPSAAADWESGPVRPFEEFTRAVAMGLFDYLRKSGHHGFVLNLSGGADSAACLCLIDYMFQLGEQAWGWQGLLKQLAYIPGVEGCPDRRALMGHLCTVLYQATDFSSETTQNAATDLSAALGVPLHVLKIQDMVDHYTQIGATLAGRMLDWAQDDIVLQNIQPRVRATAAWVFANIRHALLLVTSNRSELSVGYATMDGDTCGGLAPLGGIDKAFLLQWLRWLEQRGPQGLEPMPVLACINMQAPTAELRPVPQYDESDLMPYGLLNAIEGHFLGEGAMPLQIYQALRAMPHYADLGNKELAHYIRRFFNLWCRSQWKRVRSAPAFRVDNRSVDPLSGTRFPIFSGNFEKELSEMDSFLD